MSSVPSSKRAAITAASAAVTFSSSNSRALRRGISLSLIHIYRRVLTGPAPWHERSPASPYPSHPLHRRQPSPQPPVCPWLSPDVYKRQLVYYQEQVDAVNPLNSDSDLTLPGWDSSYTKDGLKAVVEEYHSLTEENLWDNLKYFLERIIPVAAECDVNMAIHEDDPCSVSYTHLDVYKRQL